MIRSLIAFNFGLRYIFENYLDLLLCMFLETYLIWKSFYKEVKDIVFYIFGLLIFIVYLISLKVFIG